VLRVLDTAAWLHGRDERLSREAASVRPDARWQPRQTSPTQSDSVPERSLGDSGRCGDLPGGPLQYWKTTSRAPSAR
jgi:hypothetical protein